MSQTATPTQTGKKVAVRHLQQGDLLDSGAVIHRVWSGSKTRSGYKTVELVNHGSFRKTEWNASTQVWVINR